MAKLEKLLQEKEELQRKIAEERAKETKLREKNRRHNFMKIGGIVEIVELENHPFFIGVQYHPEYKSTVANPHPLFVSFVAAAVKAKKK